MVALAKHSVFENVTVPDTGYPADASGVLAICRSTAAGMFPSLPIQTPVRFTARPAIADVAPLAQPPVIVYEPSNASPLADSVPERSMT